MKKLAWFSVLALFVWGLGCTHLIGQVENKSYGEFYDVGDNLCGWDTESIRLADAFLERVSNELWILFRAHDGSIGDSYFPIHGMHKATNRMALILAVDSRPVYVVYMDEINKKVNRIWVEQVKHNRLMSADDLYDELFKEHAPKAAQALYEEFKKSQ